MKEKGHLDVYVGCNKLIRRVWSSCDKMINNYWNESELQIIREHKKYHGDMLDYLDEFEINGPLNIEPKKPSNKLPIPYKKKKLHEYLVQNLSTADFQPGLIEPEEKTISLLTEYLTKCVQLEKNVNKQSLCFHVRCGKALNILHALWREERMRAIDVFECFTMIQVEANVDTFDALVRKLLFRFMNRCHRSTNVFVHSLLHSCRFRCSKYVARFIDLLSVNGLGEAYCSSLAL